MLPDSQSRAGRLPGVTCILTAFAALVLLATGPTAHPDPKGNADPRLRRRMSAEGQVGLPLQRYLEVVAEETKVQHRAASALADRPLAVLDGDQALRDLQAALGWAFGASWELDAKADAYLLDIRKRDREARAAALRAARRTGWADLRRRWDRVRRLAFLPMSELARLDPAEEPKAPLLRHAKSNPFVRAVFQLPGPVMERFWRTGQADVAVGTLSSELQDLVQQQKPQGRMIVGFSDGQRVEIPPSPRGDGHIYLRFGGTPERQTVFAIFQHTNGSNHCNLLDNYGLFRPPPEQRRRERAAEHTPVPDDPRFTRKVTLADPTSRRAPGLEPGERPPGMRPLAPFLKDLAAQTGMPVVAECEYLPKDQAWLRRQWWLGPDIVKQPLARALDLFCSDFECEWKFVGGCIVLRPRTWYLDGKEREYQFPDPRTLMPAPHPAP